MFDEANVFNQDIGRWNVGKVTNMYWMFGGADALRHISHITNIPTTNVLVEGVYVSKHQRHISYLANIPTTNILVKGICLMKHLECG
jgi:surface protein